MMECLASRALFVLKLDSIHRGVYVACPRDDASVEIGDCLFCEHYVGLAFDGEETCRLQCRFDSRRRGQKVAPSLATERHARGG